jgi:hypothetical protein
VVSESSAARPSPGSGRRDTRPAASSFETRVVRAGCLICSVASKSVSRIGPPRERLWSTDSAEKFSFCTDASRMNTVLKSSITVTRRSTSSTPPTESPATYQVYQISM